MPAQKISDRQKIQALTMAGIIPQAHIEGMLGLGHGAVTEQFLKHRPLPPEAFMQGLARQDVEAITVDGCPWVEMHTGDICLWVDIEQFLRPDVIPGIAASVRAMASFQRWLHQGDPRPKIFQTLLAKPKSSRRSKGKST